MVQLVVPPLERDRHDPGKRRPSGISTWGPGASEPHHQLDLSWYAIHPIEMIYALVAGTGCLEVTHTPGESGDVVVASWADGRLGTVRVLPDPWSYGASGRGSRKVGESSRREALVPPPAPRDGRVLPDAGRPPVPNEETLEIFAFMDAALEARGRGTPVRLNP